MNRYDKVNEEFVKHVHECSDVDTILKIMELERLDRIADCLEELNSNLGKCIGKEGALLINGDVTTYEG